MTPRSSSRAWRVLAVMLVVACGEGEDPVSPPPPPPPDVPRATSIAVVSGDEQRAEAGATLPEPVVVRVAAAGGSPVGGATVAFTTAEGHGTADPAEAATDAAGLARRCGRSGMRTSRR